VPGNYVQPLRELKALVGGLLSGWAPACEDEDHGEENQERNKSLDQDHSARLHGANVA
jgi:hypothetical protein